uniref:Integrase, catalytic region, zinc finger, CCHC-type, peptidase aspartic, catalytic n=1 Tax=Tanacetum cinerariifolium TaxID=118510 RepID=A0A6L2KKA5_TANCI|nr:hypothetical protein [Tanacetum cinerariifolium]
MSQDVLTVGSTMRIPLLYQGEYSQWSERFMNYLIEQTDGEAMINSIKNGDQPLPRVTQVSIAGTSSTEQPHLKDKSMWFDQEKKIQKIDCLARSLLIQGLPNDIYSLIYSNKTTKYLWDALARHMLGSKYGEQDKKATVLYEYETFKAIEGELLLDTYIHYLQVINDLKKGGYSKENCELDFKFLNNLDSDQKINANMVFIAQIKKVLSDLKASSSSADDKIAENDYEDVAKLINQMIKEFDYKIAKYQKYLFTYCTKNGILQDSSEPSNDNTNVVNALQEPFIVKQDPGENFSQSPPQINHHCCYGCGDLLEDIFYHQCTCELCGKGAHYGYNFPPNVPIIPNPGPFNNQTIDELPQTVPSFDPTCYFKDGNSFTYDSTSNLVHDSPNVFNPPPDPHEAYQCQTRNKDYYHEQNSCYDPNSFGFDQFQPPQYTVNHLIFNAQNNLFNSQNKLMEQLTSMCDMILACYDDDDDEDYTIAISPKEPDNSLSMGDEHLDTISATKSDEFIKSSVENLVPNPNPHHFNAESNLIESMLNLDSMIISSSLKIDSLFDEFAGELTLLKSIPPEINETDCDPEEETRLIKRLLYDNSSPHLPEEFIFENSNTAFESFSPSPILVEDSDSLMEEIDLSFTLHDPMPPGIDEDDYDS